MIIRPLQDRILVKRLEAQAKTVGGIFIPDNAKEKPFEGEVVSVGPGRVIDGKLRAVDVKPGDHVLFAKFSGTEVKLDDIDHAMLREDDILGILSAKKSK